MPQRVCFVPRPCAEHSAMVTHWAPTGYEINALALFAGADTVAQ